ncbi:MAG: MG2 domain-containing protein, partial [Patescibacteria group bacterium]|nr:MG2 domain-containing protein [Patescibacteria group bacterium]
MVYPKEDLLGRTKIWNYQKKFILKINKIYSLEGNLYNDLNLEYSFLTPNIIKDIFAQSPRLSYVNKDRFDPKGRLIVSFYEEINLSKSEIYGDFIEQINFVGTSAKDIYIDFDEQKIGPDQNLKVVFNKVYSKNDLLINSEPIIENIKTYPKLKIISAFPLFSKDNVNPAEMLFCVNNPIKGFNNKKTLDYINIESNKPVRLIDVKEGSYFYFYYEDEYHKRDDFIKNHCQEGLTYVLRYNLLPFTDYKINLRITDVFDQKDEINLEFTTGDIPHYYKKIKALFDYQTITTPDKTKLKFFFNNLQNVNIEICKLDVNTFIEAILEPYKKNYDYDLSKYFDNCLKIVNKNLKFDHFWKDYYIDLDLKNEFTNVNGNYLIRYWSSDPNFNKSPEYRLISVNDILILSKLVNLKEIIEGKDPFVSKNIDNVKNFIWLINLPSLKQIDGANIKVIDIYDQEIARGITNNEGMFSFKTLRPVKAIIAQKGNSSSFVISGPNVYEHRLNYVDTVYPIQKAYIYTDKPIYRPLQEVFIKGIYRIGYDSNYSILKGPFDLVIKDPNYKKVFSKKVYLNENGTFNTSFTISKDSPLGYYSICLNDNCDGYFEVAEYVPASFKVNVFSEKDEYILGEIIDLKVKADYYFGLPVSNAEVEYNILAQDYYFDKHRENYYSFWNYSGEDYCCRDKFLGTFKTKLNDNGEGIIRINLNKNQIADQNNILRSKIIVVEVTVKNSLGQSISTQKSLILHTSEYYVGIKTDKYSSEVNQPFKVIVKSLDINGKPIRLSNIDIEVFEVNWIYEKRQEADGEFYYNWQKKLKPIKTNRVITNNNGDGEFELILSKEGEYLIRASTIDRKNNKISSSIYFFIYGKGYVQFETEDYYGYLDLKLNKNNFKIEEDGELIIKSPFKQSKIIISLERGKVFDYFINFVEGSIYKFNFKIKPEYAPNMFVSVFIVSPEGKIKFRYLDFNVDIQRYKIRVEVETDKNTYLPGEEVNLKIKTFDWQDKPISTEVSLSVVDLSILALKGNPKKDPLGYFYSGFPLTILTQSNFKNLLKEIEVEEDTKGGSGGGSEDLRLKKRGIFKETAVWLPEIKTDQNGEAKIK